MIVSRPHASRRIKHVARRLHANRTRDPDFLIIGAQKCGTTSLFSLLSEHPEIQAPLTKEIHYFDRYHRHSRTWYRTHFPRTDRLIGEATPYYLAHPAVPERVARYYREAPSPPRLIAVVRDPVARAHSQHAHSVARGRERRSFREAVEAELAGPVAQPGSPEHRHRSYLLRGRYVEQLRRWTSRFPEEFLLVIDFEELTGGRSALDRVRTHLNLRSPLQALPHRGGTTRHPIDPDLEARMRSYFQPYDEALEDFLGRTPSWV